MKRTAFSMFAVVALVAVAPFAVAQSDNASIATLVVESGEVRASDGGEFVPAESGTRMEPGERVMVLEGGSAALVFDNDCRLTYAEPGVYTVPSECRRQAAALPKAATAIGAAALGVGLLASAGGGGDDGSEPPPVSR